MIELAYVYPENINPSKVCRILSIPKSSLSDELIRLKEQPYIKIEIDMKFLSDSRFKSYLLTQKGYTIIFRLKEILKVSLTICEKFA